MKTCILIIEQEYSSLINKLFPPNSADEHFGFGFAGVSRHSEGFNILLRTFIFADHSCLEKQSGGFIRPKQEFIKYVWELAKNSDSALIDFHTHPFCSKGVSFSSIDDNSENKSFPMAVDYLGEGPHSSVVFGRDSLDARWYDPQAKIRKPIFGIKIIGNRLVTITPTSISRIRGKNNI